MGMAQHIRRHTPYLQGSTLLRYVQKRGTGSKLDMHERHSLEPCSYACRATRATREHAVHRQKPMNQCARFNQGGGSQVGLLDEDCCGQLLEQGEKVGQTLTEAYLTHVDGNEVGRFVGACA